MPLFGPPNVDRLEKRRDVKGLLKALEHAKEKDEDAWETRQKAAEALGRMGAAEAKQPLTRACGDWSPPVRLAAVQALPNVDPRGDFTMANAHELMRACLVAGIPNALEIMHALQPYVDPSQGMTGTLPFSLSRGPLAIILGALVERYINLAGGVTGFHFSSDFDRGLSNVISKEAGRAIDYAIKIKQSRDDGYVPFLCCYLKQLEEAFGSKNFPTDILRSKAAMEYVRNALVAVSGVDYGDDIERYLTRWRAGS